jgi:hypothetical protein
MLTPCFGEILSYALLEYKYMKKEKVHFYFKGLNIATKENTGQLYQVYCSIFY